MLKKLKKQFAALNKGELAEALIATWCIEFLRVRKAGGFNVVEIVAISALMMGVKAVVMEASKRRYDGKTQKVVMSHRTAPMDEMVFSEYPPGAVGGRELFILNDKFRVETKTRHCKRCDTGDIKKVLHW